MRKFLLLLVGVFAGNAMLNNYIHKRSFSELVEVRNQLGEDSSQPTNKLGASIEPMRSPASVKTPIKVRLKDNSIEEVEEELAQYFQEGETEEEMAMKNSLTKHEIQSERRKLQKQLIQQ